MPVRMQELKNRKPTRVVAVFLDGNQQGEATLTAPVVTSVTRDHSYLNAHELRWSANGPIGDTGLRVGFDEHSDRISGVLLLGVVGPREDDEAALRRYARNVPDVAALWRTHCDIQRMDFAETEHALRAGAADGFGTGLQVTFDDDEEPRAPSFRR